MVDDGPLLLFDANGDGREDLLVTKGGNALPAGAPEYQPKLFLNDGRGGFRPAPDDALPPLPISAGAVAAADFNRDGRLDLFIGGRVQNGQYPLPPQSALLANRGGKFEDVTDALAPGLREVGMVTSALWSDVDGDGWPDLLLTLEWGNVKYFHNNQGKGFEDWTERAGFAAAGTGWWTSIAAADFNGDGRPDFVVGNVGLNTQYHADPQHPALLFYGDFRSDGSTQLIEGYYEGDRLYPWRSRKGLAAAIPSILKRYPMNNPLRPRHPWGNRRGGKAGCSPAFCGHGTAQRRLPQPAGRHLSLRALASHCADCAAPGFGCGGFRWRWLRGHLRGAELLRAHSGSRPL